MITFIVNYIQSSDLESFKTILEIIALLLGAYTLIFFYLNFHPVMDLNLETKWVNDNQKELIVKIEVKNISKVRCKKPKIYIQFLEYSSDFEDKLSEWIPFEEKTILPNEKPLFWKEPEVVAATTRLFFPNDSLKIERCYKCQKDHIYKVGLQLIASISILGMISKFGIFNWREWSGIERWTVAKIIYNKKDKNDLKKENEPIDS